MWERNQISEMEWLQHINTENGWNLHTMWERNQISELEWLQHINTENGWNLT